MSVLYLIQVVLIRHRCLLNCLVQLREGVAMSVVVDEIEDSVLVEQVEVGWDASAGVCGGRAAALVGGAHQGAGGAVPCAAVAGPRRTQLRTPPAQIPKITNTVVCQSKLSAKFRWTSTNEDFLVQFFFFPSGSSNTICWLSVLAFM